jgi:hypothetical protein
MPKNSRKSPRPPPLDAEPDDDYTVPVFGLCLPNAAEVCVLADHDTESIVREALRRGFGLAAIEQHLLAVDVFGLVGQRRWPGDVYLRAADVRLLDDTLKDGADARLLTVYLAEAVCHALVDQGTAGWVHDYVTANFHADHLDHQFGRGREVQASRWGNLVDAVREVQKKNPGVQPVEVRDLLRKRPDAAALLIRTRQDRRTGEMVTGEVRLKTLANILSALRTS